MIMPILQIQQQYARIGIRSSPASLEIKQPHADLSIETTPGKLTVTSPRGELRIDQRKAWDALGLGDHLEAMSRVYERSREIFLENLGKKVDEGDRMMDIRTKSTPIADIAEEHTKEGLHFDEFNFVGPASYDNVDVSYIPGNQQIDITPSHVAISFKVNKPIIQASRGPLDIYLSQRESITITPPQINTLV